MAGLIHTKLIQIPISDMSEAVSIFGKKRPDGTLPLVLVPRRSIFSWWMVIPDGVHVIMHRFGADVSAGVTAGLHILPPWYRIAFLVSKQSCAYNAPIKNCPTKDNVMVQVDLTLVFRVTNAQSFVYQLGAVKFDELLNAATEEAIRGLVRDTTHDKVYELRGSRASEFLADLNKTFERFGIVFSDATITNVNLPHELAEALEKETTFDSKQREQQKKHEYNLKLLNDKADLALKELKAQNDRLAADELAKKERAMIQKEQAEIECQRKKQLAIIKAEENASVIKYRAEAELINSKIQAEKDAALIIARAKGAAQAAKIKADQDAATEETSSKAAVAAAENRAKALIVEADAEAKAAAQLKEKRLYELEVARLEVLEKLARNGKVIISGDNGDKLIKSLCTGSLKELNI